MYRCEKCGAYLDSGEKCDCSEEKKSLKEMDRQERLKIINDLNKRVEEIFSKYKERTSKEAQPKNQFNYI